MAPTCNSGCVGQPEVRAWIVAGAARYVRGADCSWCNEDLRLAKNTFHVMPAVAAGMLWPRSGRTCSPTGASGAARSWTTSSWQTTAPARPTSLSVIPAPRPGMTPSQRWPALCLHLGHGARPEHHGLNVLLRPSCDIEVWFLIYTCHLHWLSKAHRLVMMADSVFV